MRIQLSLSLIMVCMVLTPIAANAQELEILLVNNTRKEIAYILVSPNESDNWSEDIMGRDVLPQAGRVELSIPSSYGKTCSFDLQVIYSDETTATWYNLDFCKYYTFELKPNAIVRFTVD